MLEKRGDQSSAIAADSGGANVYFGGSCSIPGKAKGMWTFKNTTSNLYTLNDAPIKTADSAGTIVQTKYYQLALTKGSNVSSVTYPTGYLSEPLTYEGKYFYKKGDIVSVDGTEATGYSIQSQTVTMNSEQDITVTAVANYL